MIEVQNLKFTYTKTGPLVLDGVSFELHPGDCMAILGVNGVGKSSMLKCLNRIHVPTEGRVLLDGRDVTKMPRRELSQNLAYVPQTTMTAHTMVFDYVLLGRKPYIRWDVTPEDKQIVRDVLQKYGLSDFESRYINELSGGEFQRVVLARAMAQQPGYLLLDEPTSNLDPKNQHEMMHAVQTITKTQSIGAAIVIHDLNLAARYCNKFLFLKDAKVFRYGGVEIMDAQTIEAVYGMPVEVTMRGQIPVIIPYPETAKGENYYG